MKKQYKWRLYLFGDIIFESDDELAVDAYKATYSEPLKKHIVKEQNTFIRKLK